VAAPQGNQFWKLCRSVGRKPIFASPEQLWEACCEYFEWVEDNPLWEVKAFAFQGEVTLAQIPKMRAMTITGLTRFLDIDFTTWKDYGTREAFSQVVTQVEQIIYEYKFTGAAAGLLNANIIARELGLRDKHDLEHTGKDGAPR